MKRDTYFDELKQIKGIVVSDLVSPLMGLKDTI